MSTSLPKAIFDLVFHTVPASAQETGVYWPGEGPGGLATLPEGGTDTLLSAILTRFVEFSTGAVIVVIIYAGYLYMTEIQNKDATAKAKKLIMYSIIGYIVVILSYSIVNVALGLPLFSKEGTLDKPAVETTKPATKP